MSDEPKILEYAKAPPGAGMADGFRLLVAVACGCAALVGLCVMGVGVMVFAELATVPKLDRPHLVFQASVVSLIGLVVTAAALRWLIHAIRARR